MKESIGPREEGLTLGKEKNLPLNWPNGVSLPTVEEVQGSTLDFEDTVRQRLGQLRGKLEGSNSDMLKTVVTI